MKRSKKLAAPAAVVTAPPAAAGMVDWLRRGLALALAATLLLSPRLWLTARDYPHTPIWSGLPQPPPPLDMVLLGPMFVALLGIAAAPSPRQYLWLMIGVAVLWAVFDQSRWQPYFTLYVLLLAFLLLLPWERRGQWSERDLQAFFTPARLLLAFMYFYSGAQKLNYTFVTDIFPRLIEPLMLRVGVAVATLPPGAQWALSLAAAVAEMAAGLCLFFPRTCRAGVLFLVAMHGFILLAIGPLGHNWNHVVWPWNLAMMLALPCLFWHWGRPSRTRDDVTPTGKRSEGEAAPAPNPQSAIRNPQSKAPHAWVTAVTVLLFGVMPALSFLDRWDSYLSFSLYSGNLREALLYPEPEDRERLPASARAVLRADGRLNPFDWSLSELGAAPYPEARVALNIGRTLARKVTRGPVVVELYSKPHPLTGKRRVRRFRCPAGGGPAEEVAE